MRKYIVEEARINSIKDIERFLEETNIVEIHLAGILFGITIFQDRRSGKICLALHKEINCFSSKDDMISRLRRELERTNLDLKEVKLIVIRGAS